MRLAVLLLLAVACQGVLCAQEVFTPPQAYPVERYEAGWSKNPFTLKTAPVLMETSSFAKDLAVGTYYGDAADPTVVLVNTKTHERITLKKGRPAANGMKLGETKLVGSRKEIYAEVTLGAETTQIHYDDTYVRQVAAAEGAKAPPPGQKMPGQQPGQPPQVRPGGMPPNGQPPGQPPGQQIKLPVPGGPGIAANSPGARMGNTGMPGNAGMAGNVGVGGNVSRPAGVSIPALSSSAPAIPAPASPSSAPVAQLVPDRRRLITPAAN